MPPTRITRGLSPVAIDPALPADPSLRALVDDVLGKLRYSFAVAAAGTAAPGRLDRIFSEFLETRSEAVRARYAETARGLLDGPGQLRAAQFARYGAVDPKEYQAAGSDIVSDMSTLDPLPVDETNLTNSLIKLTNLLSRTPPETKPTIKVDPDLKAGLAFKKMRLFITGVKCIEETDEVGSDEIYMGGNSTDPFGNTTAVSKFEVSDDFDEGERVTFGLSKAFAGWNLVTDSEGFPYVYGAVIAMAETDDGGFWKFLQDLWEGVKEAVTSAIGAAAGAAIGAAIGSAFAGLGAVIGAAVGAFIGWILSLFADNPDDIVGAKVVTMTLAAATKSYYDWAKLTTASGWTKTLAFKGDGGHYNVGIAFKAFTQ